MAANPEHLNCNCNLYDIEPLTDLPLAIRALLPILNSTLVAFFKSYYGRYAGTEGNLKTEVVDTLLLEIPDPRNVTEAIVVRIEAALQSMQQREVTHLVEEAFMDCHTAEEVLEAAKTPLGLPRELQQVDRRELDDTVFELLGVTEAARRDKLIDQLYREVAFHNRAIRIVEVQKMEQRRHGGSKRHVSQMELAFDAWNALEPEWCMPLSEWLDQQTGKAQIVSLPDGEVRLSSAGNFFDANTVYFGKKPAVSYVCSSRAEAELVAAIAREELRGPVSLPATEKECLELGELLRDRLREANARFEEMADQIAGTDRLRAQVAEQLHRWFIHGRPV